MCGICGVFNLSSKRAKEDEVRKMNDPLFHRGPDEEGYWVSGRIGLGSRRLSVIDLKTGRQPIHNEDKSLWIVFNGEIYNFPSLKESLLKKGHRFYTKTDTECLLHLYEEEGIGFLKKLDGMFALALWDGRKKKVILARDPLGEKPLFWSIFQNQFLFASEVKSILSYPGFKREIDQTSLGKYFFYSFIPSPNTIYQGIKKVRPGHCLEIDSQGKVKEQKYWEIDYSQKLSLSREEIKKSVIRLLEKAVEKRLISDVPIGIFLSGGIDSGLVAAIMSEMVSGSKINAFNLAFKEQGLDESFSAQSTAKHLGMAFHKRFFIQDNVAGLLPELIKILDEPVGDPSILPTLFLSFFASEKVKVVLSGDGGDESFGGYPKYLAHLLLQKVNLGKMPNLGLAKVFADKGKVLDYASWPLYLRNQIWISPFSATEMEELTGSKVDKSDLTDYHRRFNGKDPLDEAFFLDQMLTLSDLYLPKVDRASMAASLEVRSPFMDKDLIEFCAKIPSAEKLRGFQTKSLLREIAKDFLPKEVVSLPKKGFGIPLREWLTESLQPLAAEYLSLEKIKKDGILNFRTVDEIIKSKNAAGVWKLLAFQIWKENWLKN